MLKLLDFGSGSMPIKPCLMPKKVAFDKRPSYRVFETGKHFQVGFPLSIGSI